MNAMLLMQLRHMLGHSMMQGDSCWSARLSVLCAKLSKVTLSFQLWPTSHYAHFLLSHGLLKSIYLSSVGCCMPWSHQRLCHISPGQRSCYLRAGSAPPTHANKESTRPILQRLWGLSSCNPHCAQERHDRLHEQWYSWVPWGVLC